MRNLLFGTAFGVILVLSAGVTYRVVVQPTVYTDVLDVNDQIYTGLTIQKDFMDRFGNCERTLIVYNLSFNRLMLSNLAIKVKKLEDLVLYKDLEPPGSIDSPGADNAVEANEVNEPNEFDVER